MGASDPLEAAGGRRTVVAIGAMYVALAAGYPFFPFADDPSVSLWIVLGLLVGCPGLFVLYGGLWLPRTNIRLEFYSTIAAWCLRGIAAGLGIVVPIVVASSESNVVPNTILLTSLGCLAGFAAGSYHARAKSRQLELQETIEELERSNERLEQFARAASHDLQEPLRMVSSYLQLLESRYADDLDEDAREYIDFAVDGADRMRAMIDGILEYSDVERRGDPFEPVDLNAVLADVRDDLQVRIGESGAEVETGTLPHVEGDPAQLRLVFHNLLDNAIEYSGDQTPRIHVSAERDAENDAMWTISVRDEGIGIDPEYTERVFEVFQRLHGVSEYPGTGIGLAICERIVERHGGDIWADSEPGEGTTFTFTLPAVDGHEG